MKNVTKTLMLSVVMLTTLTFAIQTYGITITVGTGTVSCNYPYTTYWMGGRTQLIYTAAQMIAAGATPGEITSIGFNVYAYSSQTMVNFNINMMNTTMVTLPGWVTGLQNCYTGSYAVPGTGWQMITLQNSFYWTGNSIILEICYGNNGSYTSYSYVYGTTSPVGQIEPYWMDNTIGCSYTGVFYTGYTGLPNLRFDITTLEPLSSCESARIDPTTMTIWNGSIDNDWFNQANWNDGVPGSIRQNAWIPSGLANYPTISNPGAVCHDIYIRDGASILGNGFLSISGLAYVERLVNHLGLTNYWQHCNWLDDSLAITYPADIHYLSSPVPDAKDSTVEQDAVWRWQEPDQYWKWLHHSCSEPCKGPPWIWTPGIGYSVAPNEYWWCETDDCSDYNTPPGLCAAPWKYQFYREFIDNGLNYGSIDVPLTYTVQLPGMLYPPGWNLLGNPYPSAIDWFAVPTVNVYTNSACMWCDTIGGYKYVVGQNGFIPIIQGFMVQCAPGGGSVTFIEAARLHNNNAPLWKSRNTSFLTLQVRNSVNSYKDETYIAFNPEAQDGFDLLDGTKLGNLSNAPMIYSVLPDNTSLAVNSLNSSQTAYQVPVHFKAGVAGNHTINVTGIESINDNTPLYLEDRKLDISQDIRGNPVYTFSANPSDDRDRFILHFAPLGIKDFSLSNVAIYSYDKNVCINVPAEVIGTASVINLLGMEILSQKLIPGKLNKISVTGLTGYYVVRVVSSGNVFTQKVFIN